MGTPDSTGDNESIDQRKERGVLLVKGSAMRDRSDILILVCGTAWCSVEKGSSLSEKLLCFHLVEKAHSQEAGDIAVASILAELRGKEFRKGIGIVCLCESGSSDRATLPLQGAQPPASGPGQQVSQRDSSAYLETGRRAETTGPPSEASACVTHIGRPPTRRDAAYARKRGTEEQ
ncbi:hypothetical protein TREES_T100017935 [Tupaia chinensis]|uniref:Uncharacterized protein n=1 Tax=Tupaia chinensis TaxID=246437 RepID=L9JQV7_TUPCH|nr:hypothetical protein TREES_T100017935 [Tupaia chinensis]